MALQDGTILVLFVGLDRDAFRSFSSGFSDPLVWPPTPSIRDHETLVWYCMIVCYGSLDQAHTQKAQQLHNNNDDDVEHHTPTSYYTSSTGIVWKIFRKSGLSPTPQKRQNRNRTSSKCLQQTTTTTTTEA
eukprot:scaffold2256_cov166-Amphora_coffeaeformis.AAC.6